MAYYLNDIFLEVNLSENDTEEFEKFKAKWLKFCRSGMVESFVVGAVFGVIVMLSVIYKANPIIAAIYATSLLMAQRVLVHMKDCESEAKLGFVRKDDDDDSSNSCE